MIMTSKEDITDCSEKWKRLWDKRKEKTLKRTKAISNAIFINIGWYKIYFHLKKETRAN